MMTGWLPRWSAKGKRKHASTAGRASRLGAVAAVCGTATVRTGEGERPANLHSLGDMRNVRRWVVFRYYTTCRSETDITEIASKTNAITFFLT